MRKPSTEREGNCPKSHSKCYSQDLNPSPLQVILPSHSAGITNSCAYRVRQAVKMQDAGLMWEILGQHCPIQIQWEPDL